MAHYRPRGAGAGEPPSGIAAPAPAAMVYRPPTEKELKDMIKLFHLHEDESDYILTADDADKIYNWLKQRPDLSVDWFYDERKYGPLRKLNDVRYQFNTSHNSILAMIFMTSDIPVNHILINELCCRNPDFTLEDGEYGGSIIQNMRERIEDWDRAGVKKNSFHDNYIAMYELATNPDAIKEKCIWLTTRRQAARNGASLQLATKEGFARDPEVNAKTGVVTKEGRKPIPEGPMSVISGFLTGKPGSTAQQMAALKKNIYIPSNASSSSSSSAAAAAASASPPPAATARRRRRRRWYGGPKKGGRMTRRR